MAAESDWYDASGDEHPVTDQILSLLSNKLRPFLDAAEALNNDGCISTVHYPNLVVIGDQSEGKSTVLEAISSVKLPKDTKLCTKCPIQLCLRKGEEKAEISYKLGPNEVRKPIYQKEIDKEISRAQEALVASSGSKIVDETIQVLIQTPNGFNLTLIDLPGINRYTHEDEDQTIRIIERFIESEQTIIMVVFKCTTDQSAVKAFQLARKYDQEGDRTFAVITHCDTLSENWEEQIQEMVSPSTARGCKIQYIPVACRDYITGGPAAEQNVLHRRAVFRDMNPEMCGTRQLIVKLCKEVLRKLTPWTNEISGLVMNKRSECQAKLDALLKGKPTEAAGSRTVASNLLYEFAKEFEEQVTGTHRTEKNELFSDCVRKLNDFEIEIRNSTDETKKRDVLMRLVEEEFNDQLGCEFPQAAHLFPVLRRIVKVLVQDKYRSSTMDVFEKTKDAVNQHMLKISEQKFGDYPPFLDFMNKKLKEIAEPAQKAAQTKLLDIIKMEKACVQTRHPQFMESTRVETDSGRSSLSTAPVPQIGDEQPEPTEGNTDYDCYRIQEANKKKICFLLTNYLQILANRMIDTVSGTIVYQLNHKLAKKIRSIHAVLPDQDALHRLMKNPDKEAQIRVVRQQLNLWSKLDDSLKQKVSPSSDAACP